MNFEKCHFNKRAHCPKDNRVCRYCTPDIAARTKIIIAMVLAILLFIIAAGCEESKSTCGKVAYVSQGYFRLHFRPADGIGASTTLYVETNRPDTVRVGQLYCLQLSNKSANQ